MRAGLQEQPRTLARRWVTGEWLDLLSDAVEREDLEQVLIVAPSRFSLRERALRLAAARNPRMPAVVSIEPERAAAIDLDGRRTLVHLGSRLVPAPDTGAQLRSARVIAVEGVLRPEVVALVDELIVGGDFELLGHSPRRGGYYVLRHRLGTAPARGAPPSGQPRAAVRQSR